MAFPLESLISEGLKIINKFIPDSEQKAKAEMELRDALMKWDQAQTEVNKIEASNPNMFVAGWRPWIGWTCGMALAYQYVLTPIIMWIAAIALIDLPQPSKLDESLWQLMTGMLGMAGLRTYEKLKGVAVK